MRPLIDVVLDCKHSDSLSRDLLELNARIQLVKLGMTEAGELSLSCQVLASQFDAETLGAILGIIGYYADEVAPDIYHRLATLNRNERPSMLS